MFRRHLGAAYIEGRSQALLLPRENPCLFSLKKKIIKKKVDEAGTLFVIDLSFTLQLIKYGALWVSRVV